MLPHLYCDVMRTMTLGKTERVVPNTTKRLRANLEKLIVTLFKRMRSPPLEAPAYWSH